MKAPPSLREDDGLCCSRPDCGVEWLLDPAGPSDPAWIARIRAELASAPSLVGTNNRRAARWERLTTKKKESAA